MAEYLFSRQSSPQVTPLAIARLVANNTSVDILSPPKTPMIVTQGELPALPNTSANPASLLQSTLFFAWTLPWSCNPIPPSRQATSAQGPVTHYIP